MLFDLHLVVGFFILLLLNIIIGLAGALAVLFLAFHGCFTLIHSLFEFPAWESPCFFVFVDDRAGSCNFESKFLDGLSNRHSFFQHHLNEQHSFLYGKLATFMGILE